MSGEFRMVRQALISSAWLAPPAAAIAFLVRGGDAAVSVALAVGLVLANTAVAALVLVLVARRNPLMAPAAAMPSYVFRMAGMLAALAFLRKAEFVDKTVFAVAFGLAVVWTLWIESRVYGRTPWAALTFMHTDSARQGETS